LVSVSSRNLDEKIASIGRVLGDRSLLYKYLNPNILVVAVASKITLTIYLLDNVSGQILYETKHRDVDISKGVHTHIVENVVYWSYYTNGRVEGRSRGDKITVAELYESPIPNERYNTYSPSHL
jgi:ER membrane protein complex subunit 1